MNGKLILLTFLSSLLVGCREREIPADIERDVVSLPARFATGEYRSFVDSLYNRISGLPDSSSRVKCYRFVWDTLFNIEVDTDNPNSFYNLITAVEENLYRSITYLYAGEQSRDEIVRRQIDRIAWTKRQLDRMRPERMITSEDYESPKDQISAWRNAYLFVKDNYEARLKMIEKSLASNRISWLSGVCTTSELETARKLLSKKIGRPVRAGFDFDIPLGKHSRDEADLVRSGRIGPAWMVDVDNLQKEGVQPTGTGRDWLPSSVSSNYVNNARLARQKFKKYQLEMWRAYVRLRLNGDQLSTERLKIAKRYVEDFRKSVLPGKYEYSYFYAIKKPDGEVSRELIAKREEQLKAYWQKTLADAIHGVLNDLRWGFCFHREDRHICPGCRKLIKSATCSGEREMQDVFGSEEPERQHRETVGVLSLDGETEAVEL